MTVSAPGFYGHNSWNDFQRCLAGLGLSSTERSEVYAEVKKIPANDPQRYNKFQAALGGKGVPAADFPEVYKRLKDEKFIIA